MTGVIKRLFEIYRNEGVPRLFHSVFIHTLGKIEDVYWDLHGGTQSFTVGGVTATFDGATAAGGGQVRWGIRNEEKMLSDFVRSLRPDDVVIDVGANVGVYSCFASRKITEGQVVAFEPYPPNVDQIRRNVSLNGGEVEIIDVALSDSAGQVELERPRLEQVGGATASLSHGGTESTFSAEGVPGDQLVTQGTFPQPTVVKIDVEGAESVVVDGLKETLSRDECRLLYCEVHLPSVRRSSLDDFGTSPEEFRSMIRELGFELEILEQRPYETHLKARKN